ncbi:uncharacterized protein PV09_09731 [Verruconis gallopava]|uniref:Uncharacterized protein n=1 Tax=Verruconis gallopava TaxID=253628 RepID=A0A0D1X8V4_9PEZI|nr:uncharacterized protein PV09_09731 [Verruconis gallopava]KIV98465.1 hypothetical protein PV09_09731 [Verruconis gallopava]
MCSLTDEQIILLCHDPTTEIISLPECTNRVVRITDGLAAKFGRFVSVHEFRNQHIAQRYLDPDLVRVLKFHRYIEKEGTGYIIMDYVDGHILDLQCARMMAERLGKVLNHLHAQTATRPGSLGGGPLSGALWPEHEEVEFSEAEDLQHWLQSHMPKSAGRIDLNGHTFSMCHLDFSPRNIMVDGDRIYLVDWSAAAYLPRFFEFLVYKFLPQDLEFFALVKPFLLPLTEKEQESVEIVAETLQYARFHYHPGTKVAHRTRIGMTDFSGDARIVHLIQAVCHPFNENYNHWSLNIQFKNRAADVQVAGSIRCHMIVNADDGETMYTVTTHAYAVTTNCVFTVEFPPTSSQLPVGCVSSIIRNNNLHMFEYSSEGSGCRHWIYVVIQHLEATDYIAQGSAARLWPYLHHFYEIAVNGQTGLTVEQAESVNQDSKVRSMLQEREPLRVRLKGRAAETPTCQKVSRLITNEKERVRRALLEEIQRKYELESSVRSIEEQLAGVKVRGQEKVLSYFSEDTLADQRRLIETMILAPPGATLEEESQRRDNAVNAVIAYCKIEEGDMYGGRKRCDGRRGAPDVALKTEAPLE